MIRPISSSRRSSGGFTLLEVLIATAVTLLLMLGLAQIFRVLGDSITKGRASLELNNRLRNVIHRIRTDLESVTVNPIPPIKHGSAQGYLKYYDGPATDFSFATNPLLNRFGDLDDIFMATIKAEDAWFTGKVPRFVLNGTNPTLVDADSNGIQDALEDLVTISSQFAEVVIFAEPLTSVVGNPLRDPVFLAGDVSNFEDSFPGTPGVPDGFRLHYRLLLIRPDLNLTTLNPSTLEIISQLPSQYDTMDPNNRRGWIFRVGEEDLLGFHPSAASLPSPTCDMFRVHQFCDLSVRRVYKPDPFEPDAIAANSLEDLANPANRFAHVQYQIPGTGTDVYYSMPVLGLGPTISAFQGTNPSVAGAGFLHPAFTLFGNRTGEDLLASDILAFDIKAFDTSAPVVRNFGANATNDGGAVGSDDVMLRPGDPGFYTHGIQALGLSATIESQGEFVDLCWADDVKLGTKPNSMSTAQFDTQYVFLQSVLSGIRFDAGYDEYPVTSLFKSGLAIPGMIYQPSYDTFTDYYESNGKVERERLPLRGTVQLISGTSPSLPDAGTDGVDSNGDNLPDDPFEKETNPPFETNLRGLQISVRLEDRATKQFSQMSTIKEFVNH
jgi:type II secretory pathway pseudopilin PulG